MTTEDELLMGDLPGTPHMPPAWVLNALQERVPQWMPLDTGWQFCGTLAATAGRPLPDRVTQDCKNCGRLVVLYAVVAQTQLKPKNVAATFLYYLGRCDCGWLLWRQPGQGTVGLGQKP